MRMKKIYIVTGANGHLGGTLVRMLSKRGEAVRGLVLPGEAPQPFPHVRYYTGDVRDADSMRPLFADAEDAELLVLHTAGLVDIADAVSDRLYDVNVNGTKNMLALCREYGVRRLVYVSSVHAIPEEKSPAVLKEVASFSPERVTGGYAKTKAKATQAVLDAVQAGLDAVVVHPSGIIGPFDTAGNHLVQLVRDYLRGALPACVRGGYDSPIPYSHLTLIIESSWNIIVWKRHTKVQSNLKASLALGNRLSQNGLVVKKIVPVHWTRLSSASMRNSMVNSQMRTV